MKNKKRAAMRMMWKDPRRAGQKVSGWLIRLLRLVLIVGLCYVILKPLIQYFLYACMSQEDFRDYTVSMIPKHWSGFYWKKAAELLELFQGAAVRSLLFALTVALLQMISSMVIGYGLARFRFPGKKLLTVMLFVVMLVPGTVLQLPEYFQFRYFGFGGLRLNLINTLVPYYILSLTGLGLKQALYIFLMRMLFSQMPVDLENAAYIDGAGVFRTFLSVAVPQCKSLMITVFLFAFCWTWTDSSFATAFYPDISLLSSRLLKLDGMMGSSAGNVTYAGIMIMVIPILILVVVCQKHLVKSISMSGMAN